MLVIGVNSSAYRCIKESMPPHEAISHSDIGRVDITKYRVVVFLSWDHLFRDEFQDLFSFVLQRAEHFVFISTSGLNGCPQHLRERYRYLSSKRHCEILTLKAGGLVLRCGAFGLSSDPISPGSFYVSQEDIANIPWETKATILAVGRSDRKVQKTSQLFTSGLFALLSRHRLLTSLFVGTHAIGKLLGARNIGYTALSDRMALADASVGQGLSSLPWRQFTRNRRPTVYFYPPETFRRDIINEDYFNSRSYARNGFGARWHGVRPITKRTGDTWLFVPFFNFYKYCIKFFCFTDWSQPLLVQYITKQKHGVTCVGVSSDGHLEIQFVSSVTLNCGLYEANAILSRSLRTEMRCNFNFHMLHFFKSCVVKKLPNTELLIGGFLQSVSKIAAEGNRGIVSIKPEYPIDRARQIVFGTFATRLRSLLTVNPINSIQWILATRLGINIWNPAKSEVCVQWTSEVHGSFSADGSYMREHSIGCGFVESEVRDLLLQDDNIVSVGPLNAEVIDALHVHSSSCCFEEYPTVTSISDGGIYVGSVANLVGFSSVFHTSYRLLSPHLRVVKGLD